MKERCTPEALAAVEGFSPERWIYAGNQRLGGTGTDMLLLLFIREGLTDMRR
tara:strand:+ start:393 stop:548 length:156 start_codon:yes stop_codon:yes gene_type:complete